MIKLALGRYLKEGNEYKEIYEAEDGEKVFGDHLRRLIQMVKNWAQQKTSIRWWEAWQTPDITELRRIYTSAAWRVRSDRSGVEESNEASKSYKNAVDLAKRKYWNDFLANANKNDVWMAHQFRKQRQPVMIPGGHHDTSDQTSQKIMKYLFPSSNDLKPPKVFRRTELEEDSCISKKIILRPISPRSPCAPDLPGAYNVNSSSGYVCADLFRLEVKGPRQMRPDATGSVWMHGTQPFCVQTP